MIHSMTGYGKTSATYGQKTINVEIKSLNSKNLDLNVRIAPLYREKEMEVRNMLSVRMLRGKIDFSIWIERDNSAEPVTLNPSLISNYYSQIKQISDVKGIPAPQDPFQMIMRLPDVFTTVTQDELTDDEWQVVNNLIITAIDNIEEFRLQEGEALKLKFEEKIANITSLLAQIEPYEKSRVEKIRERIIDGLASIPDVEYDKNRLEQELIYYIEKLDISEEKQRLANHLRYFTETLNGEIGQGKKLGFIAQEMGREINTMGSKSNQAEMQNIVVKMKDELEQIKEQVLNAL